MRETVRRLHLRPAERLLDVGCGTGVLLAAVAGATPGAFALGVDISPEMLGVGRGRCPGAVGFVAADVEQLPFSSGSFDVVVSSSSFHYWSNPAKGLEEIRRLLRPGGRLVLTDWCDDYVACKVCDVVLRWVDSAYRRSYGSTECRRFLEEAGYEVDVIERYKIDWMWGVMTARASRSAARAAEGSPAAR